MFKTKTLSVSLPLLRKDISDLVFASENLTIKFHAGKDFYLIYPFCL